MLSLAYFIVFGRCNISSESLPTVIIKQAGALRRLSLPVKIAHYPLLSFGQTLPEDKLSPADSGVPPARQRMSTTLDLARSAYTKGAPSGRNRLPQMEVKVAYTSAATASPSQTSCTVTRSTGRDGKSGRSSESIQLSAPSMSTWPARGELDASTAVGS